MMIVAVISGLFVLAQADAPPSAAAVQAAMNKYLFCMADTASTLDDGHSDAATIAAAIQYSCPNELGTYMAALKASESPAMVPYVDGATDDIERDVALKAVLAERRRAALHNSN